jgi:hypothetical protein
MTKRVCQDKPSPRIHISRNPFLKWPHPNERLFCRGIGKAETILTFFFDAIHGFIRLPDQLFHIIAIVGIKRNPDAGADNRRASVEINGPENHAEDVFGDPGRVFGGMNTARDDQELVPSNPVTARANPLLEMLIFIEVASPDHA